jgi:hypothetical protein
MPLQTLNTNANISSPTPTTKFSTSFLGVNGSNGGTGGHTGGYANGHGGHGGNENMHAGFRLAPLPGPNQFFGDGMNVSRGLNNNPLCMQPGDFHLHPFGHIQNAYRHEPTASFRPINAPYNHSPLFNNYFSGPAQGQQGQAEREATNGGVDENFYDGTA